MTKKNSQNVEVYKKIANSGKSLLQLYIEALKEIESLKNA